jgi:hydrogenase maturation factor HypF (carbamoyltransferase family)
MTVKSVQINHHRGHIASEAKEKKVETTDEIIAFENPGLYMEFVH